MIILFILVIILSTITIGIKNSTNNTKFIELIQYLESNKWIVEYYSEEKQEMIVKYQPIKKANQGYIIITFKGKEVKYINNYKPGVSNISIGFNKTKEDILEMLNLMLYPIVEFKKLEKLT